MNTAPSADPWATNDHDQLSHAGPRTLWGLRGHPHPLRPTPSADRRTTHRTERRNIITDTENVYTDWDLEIEDYRGQLISSLNTALTALAQASIAIAALTSNQVYDVEFAEDTAGADVAAFVADSLRDTRAAYAITRDVTERS